MLLEFFLIPCLFVSFTGWGAWMKALLRDKNESFSLTIILGLVLFGILTCLLSFFIPLSLYVELALLIISLIPFLSRKLRTYMGRFPKEILRSVWFWIFGIVIILAGTYYPFRPDLFFYYVPTLSWLNQYGQIIGVANIDWVLGQMSVFHIMQAGLDQTIDPFLRFAVFITILFLVYLFERKTYLLLLVIPFYFLFIQAPSPDVPVVFLSLIVINELCFNYRVDNYKILFLISVFVFTIKPIAFWLPLWIFIAGFFLNKNKLKDYRIYLIPTLLVIIFLIKNVIASSTLFYPITITKLNTYWLPDFRIFELSDQRASMFTFSNYFTEGEIGAMTFFQKVYYWLSINKLQSIINWTMLMVIVAFGIFSFVKKNIIYQLLWIIVAIKSFVIFNYSGQFRFILDSIYPLLFILLYPVLKIGKTKIFIAGLAFSFLLLAAITYPPLLKRTIPSFDLARWMDGFDKTTLLVPGKYVNKQYTKENVGNLDFNISSIYHYNYDVPLPAIIRKDIALYYKLGIFPQMKDPAHIHKGYYMKTLEPEEKEKLEKIVETYCSGK